MNRLVAGKIPIDMLTVVEQLKRDDQLEAVGGPLYIAQLTEKVASAAHIEFHARIIQQKALARDVIQMTSSIQSKAFDDSQDISEVMEDMEKSFTDLVSGSAGCQSMSMSEALKKAVDEASLIQEQRNTGVDPSIPTGLKILNDEFAGGWHAPDLIILGAKPSMLCLLQKQLVCPGKMFFLYQLK